MQKVLSLVHIFVTILHIFVAYISYSLTPVRG